MNKIFYARNCEVAFLSHYLGDLGVTLYVLHLCLVGKRMINFPLKILASFNIEALRAISNFAFSQGGSSF